MRTKGLSPLAPCSQMKIKELGLSLPYEKVAASFRRRTAEEARKLTQEPGVEQYSTVVLRSSRIYAPRSFLRLGSHHQDERES